MLRLRDRRTAPQRRSVRLQLETLENREVPSAVPTVQPEATTAQTFSPFVQPPSVSQTLQQTLQPGFNSTQPLNLSQAFQQMLQTAHMTLAGEAPSLQQMLTSLVSELPSISNGLNILSADLTRYAGPQAAQQYTQGLVQGLDLFIIELEGATQISLQAAGMFPNPAFNMDVAVLNAFMANPLS